MNRENLLDEMVPDDVPEPFKRLAGIIGVKAVYTLITLLGGQRIYILKPDAFFKEAVRQRIIQDAEKGSCTHQNLADKYDISCKTVGRYLRDANTKKPI